MLRSGLLTLASLGYNALVFGLCGLLVLYAVLAPQLPPVEQLREVKLQEPLRVYSADGKLLAEYGEQRRQPLYFHEYPDLLIKAFLAAEDDRYFVHAGVDYEGLARAGLEVFQYGEMRSGGSTITMQVARNFFLSSERKLTRKLAEIMLALQIEGQFNKAEILELYLNKIFLGQRAYGVAAAAQVYYGKYIGDLSLAEIAMLAGLPKGPSTMNPVVNPERALQRRNYVLRRMHDLEFIDDKSYAEAVSTPDDAKPHRVELEFNAPQLAELVRGELVRRYGEEATYTSGWRAYITVDTRTQQQADQALRLALRDYDERHGYRGAYAHWALSADSETQNAKLRAEPVIGGLLPALVLEAGAKRAKLMLADGQALELALDGVRWARPTLEQGRGKVPGRVDQVVRPGDVVRVVQVAEQWRLAQVPQVSGALVALHPRSGAYVAVSGGFDPSLSKFNRATDAVRQPGSSFKPFLYAAALAKGWTPATVLYDRPLSFKYGNGKVWRPQNSGGGFLGPIPMRRALAQSRNLASIDLLRRIGLDYGIEFTRRFGFDTTALPHSLVLALGAGGATPAQLAAGYAVFANGGFKVEPYLLARLEDSQGRVLYTAKPLMACAECPVITPQPLAEGELLRYYPVDASVPFEGQPAPRVLDPTEAYLMQTMLAGVIQDGTAKAALKLKRSDLAGKTGTTNDYLDAWFAGFQRELVTVAWVGFDQPRSLGARETGGRTALPMWMTFMGQALATTPEAEFTRPQSLVMARVNRRTGKVTSVQDPESVLEPVSERALHAELPEAPPEDELEVEQPGSAPLATDTLADDAEEPGSDDAAVAPPVASPSQEPATITRSVPTVRIPAPPREDNGGLF